MPVNSSPHGIGQILNEINNEYQREYNTTEQIFNLGDTDVTVMRENATAPGAMEPLYASAMATLNSGNLFGNAYPAVSQLNNQVGTVSAQGEVLQRISPTGGVGDMAQGVAVDFTNGTLWKTDEYEANIHNVTRTGDLIKTINAPVPDTYGIAVDPIDGYLWVCDVTNGMIKKLDRSGNILRDISAPEGDATDIACDPTDGTLWVASNTSIYVYNIQRDGTAISSFSANLNNSLNSEYLSGIAVDPLNGNIWTTNSDGTNGDNICFEQDRTGTVIQQFNGPDNDNASGISMDYLDGSIWQTSNNDELFHWNRFASGRTVEIGDTVSVVPEHPV